MRSVIYQREEKISFYDLDANGDIKLTALLKYMGEASSANAEALGASYEKNLEIGLTFIIQRLGVRFFKVPKLSQKVTIRTWPAQTTRSAFKRNGDIYDEDKNKMMEWESLWVLIDINERRIKRPSVLPIEFPLYGKMGVEVEADKIVIPSERKQLASYIHTVFFSELDVNSHMNNSVYADLIANVLTLKNSLNIKAWKEVQFNYVNEAKLNDEVMVNAHQSNDSLYISGGSGEKTIFTAMIKCKE